MELHKLENYDLHFIESLILNEIEESIHIDFKAGDALSKIDSKKKEISKDISAFANSNGGIIIYGLSEVNHKASHISYVNGNEFTKEWLEQVISSSIQRNIPALKIFPIRKNGNISESIYVVQIPESTESPHICKDKKFYKRYNFESVAMEEYEVRQLYGRTTKSKLILSGYNISLIEVKEEHVSFLCESGIFNEGDKKESDYKLNIYFENIELNNIKIYWPDDNSKKNYDYTRLPDKKIKITSTSVSPVYQNEAINVIRFNFNIKKEKVEEVMNNIKIKFKLFYNDGFDEMETDLRDYYLRIKNQL